MHTNVNHTHVRENGLRTYVEGRSNNVLSKNVLEGHSKMVYERMERERTFAVHSRFFFSIKNKYF